MQDILAQLIKMYMFYVNSEIGDGKSMKNYLNNPALCITLFIRCLNFRFLDSCIMNRTQNVIVCSSSNRKSILAKCWIKIRERRPEYYRHCLLSSQKSIRAAVLFRHNNISLIRFDAKHQMAALFVQIRAIIEQTTSRHLTFSKTNYLRNFAKSRLNQRNLLLINFVQSIVSK